ncbi:MAG: GGDEF domain-containing protein [Zetaproteobacteria bacterium CG12_big_fil_rev_8_21_14_0_65_54_13]|nr:MAG: GGDEF domain-containing protein [Zetaproteobacteria bacterium CG23_combo_of_CG06-09_8_20_14_all_54_7]PIW51217.1 MAG: GGDEF domain-containing protein [Zetaproteobacteria bacterium CG12_big_fil_rev_8_21_14_0_65_54_13]PIX53515.1 MAG: GGDEF domain-containing protein [Zetaproteobacteria bacterium CG_4_10_14_3_um_filter_54_28]PJA28325.1 MAG: GGDEF domain-containing protein [Zetaproteobacteria bacterium CG_4_9_14_3_um_filter_54_145]
MTLSRQLITLISITFLLIFSGTFWISVENTRSYLMLQLATQTQNTANSLGLSLVPHLQRGDVAAMDTMINAVFDSGYYKSLSLSKMSGKVLIERENTSRIEGVPQWFIEHLNLQTPHAESIITTGWIQAGRLTLVAHPGFAYKKLWETTQQTLLWSLLAFLVSMIAVLSILRAILRPLKAVEDQALAICERDFPIVGQIPRTRELKRMVLAMNRMSAKLKSIISKLSERAEQMRRDALADPLTGLANRRAFNAMLEHAIHDREQGGAGSLAIIRISGFADYNRQHGIQAGDDLLIDIANKLSVTAASWHMATVARITGTDFAVILPQTDITLAHEAGQAISSAVIELADTTGVVELAHTGIALFHHDSRISEIMVDADAALATASHSGGNSYAVQNKTSAAQGNIAWKQLIEKAIQSNSIRLLAQPVLNRQHQVVYSEILIRIRDQADSDIAPGIFSAMADRLGLNESLDQLTIMQASALIEAHKGKHSPLAVNLSPHSIRSPTFNHWLEQHYLQHAGLGDQLLFEISEHGLLQDITQAAAFITLVHAHRGKVVMEHFGTRLSSFQALRQLKVDYIKLSGSYTRDITVNSDNRFFLQTVTDIAHGLDIEVIAEQIETAADAEAMQALGINVMQGYYFGEPASLQA